MKKFILPLLLVCGLYFANKTEGITPVWKQTSTKSSATVELSGDFHTYSSSASQISNFDLVGGSITKVGTVDGRDVSADGTKLDTIGISTGNIQSQLNAVQASTFTVASLNLAQYAIKDSVGTSTATLRTDLTTLQVSTVTAGIQVPSIAQYNATALATGTFALVTSSNFANVVISTSDIQSQISVFQSFISTQSCNSTSDFIATKPLKLNTNAYGNAGNTAFGYNIFASSLYNNTVVNNNSAFGSYALQNFRYGDENTAIGGSALPLLNVGFDNTAIGFASLSLSSATTGSIIGNTAIGAYAGRNNATGQRNVFIGYQAGEYETGSNKLYIANSRNGVPFIYGEFDNHIASISANVSFGTYTVTANSFVGSGSGITGIPTNAQIASIGTSTATLRTDLTNEISSRTAINIATEEPIGFENRTTSSMTISGLNFTISGTNFPIWIKGVLVSKSTETITLSNTAGLHYIYYTNTGSGVLSESSSFPGFDFPLVSFVYYSTQTTSSIINDERHGIVMDFATHELMHDTVGTRYASGLTGSFNNTTSTITAGHFHDEDLDYTVSQTTKVNVFYKSDSSVFKWTGLQNAPYFAPDGTLRYNNGTSTATVPTTSGGNYVASWVFATNDINSPIMVVIGQRVDTSLANAIANNTYSTLSLTALPSLEMKLLYRVIYRNVAGTPTWIQTDDYRSVPSLPSTSFIPTSHNNLNNLDLVSSGHPYDVAGGFASADSVSNVKVSASTGTLPGTFPNTVLITTANVSASGTASATTYLRGDGTWSTPAGGSGSGNSLTNVYTQNSHDFSVGQAVYYDGTTWKKSKADAATTADVLGIIDSVGTSTFSIVMQGVILNQSGLTSGSVYYVSATSSGTLTTTEPTTYGQVSKPVLYALGTSSGVVINMRGVVVTSTTSIVTSANTWSDAQSFSTITYIVPSKCRVYLNGDTSGITGGTGAYVLFNTKVFDSSSEYSVSASSFVAKTSGYYFVKALVTLGNFESGKEYQIVLNKNGGAFSQPDCTSGAYVASSLLSLQASDLVYLSAGDNITVTIYNGSAGNSTFIVGSTAYTHLTIYKVSN